MPLPKLRSEFISGGEVRPVSGWHMPRHHHPFHELIVVLDGAMDVRTDDGVVHGEPGDLLFYRATCVHEEFSDAARPVSTFFIAFQADASVVSDFPWCLRDADARVRQMVSSLVRDCATGMPAEELTPLLRAVLRELKRLNASPIDPWLADLRGHMQRNLARPVYLDDLARRACMSKFAFVRKFKRLCGRTPMRELQLLRVNQARAMLLASGLPVKAIAAAVGLNDEYQLSKLFRRHLRLSPREMRARSQTAAGAAAAVRRV